MKNTLNTYWPDVRTIRYGVWTDEVCIRNK